MMLATSPSPRLDSSPRSRRGNSCSPHGRYEQQTLTSKSKGPVGSSSPIVKPHSSHVDTTTPQLSKNNNHSSSNQFAPPTWSHESISGSSIPASLSSPPHTSRRNMVDAATQYSPPPGYRSSPPPRKIVTTVVRPPTPQPPPAAAAVAAISLPVTRATAMPAVAPVAQQPLQDPTEETTSPINKRHNTYNEDPKTLKPDDVVQQPSPVDDHGPSKRARGETPPLKVMPIQYELCDTRELVLLISSMLMELIRYNDAIPLRDGALTRFHSRAPPGISVLDYLQRLTTHATLSPPILLSMVFYIDKLCALYPAFTISSLTVHRFLITSATVASKGLSDSFWTNKTYARVGGVSIKELATLELEFLGRVQWRIVPKPEVLIDYYRSLVERSPGYELEKENP